VNIYLQFVIFEYLYNIFAKFGCAIYENSERTQTNKQTDTQTQWLQYFAPLPEAKWWRRKYCIAHSSCMVIWAKTV